MANFPLAELLCLVVGLAVSGLLYSVFTKIAVTYNIGLTRLFGLLPRLLTFLYVPLVLFCAPCFCYSWTWCFSAYRYFKAGELIKALLSFLLNCISCFYNIVITKDLRNT